MNTLARSFACALALTIALGAGQATASEDQDLYNRGRDAVFEEHWESARSTFEEFARRFPTSSYADDAHYWLGMSLYELGQADKAYAILKNMNVRFPDSPWSDDARVLMVRCAESVLKDLARPGSASPLRSAPEQAAEYEAFLERSTHDSSSKVQLLAIDTVLGSKPGKAPELLPRLSNGGTSREAAGIVLDRFFDGEKVKVTMENPSLGLTDGNVAVMVRKGDRVEYLTLAETLDLVHGPGSTGGPGAPRFDAPTVADIREKLLAVEKSLRREGDPGTVETLPARGGRSMSAIIKVVDGEVHYYRNGDETTRIVVLRRQAGFKAPNIRIFVESPAGVREITLEEARRLPSGEVSLGNGGASAAGSGSDLSESTIRYLKAALAIIELDLTRSMNDGAK